MNRTNPSSAVHHLGPAIETAPKPVKITAQTLAATPVAC